jgi:hypothetical protein
MSMAAMGSGDARLLDARLPRSHNRAYTYATG